MSRPKGERPKVQRFKGSKVQNEDLAKKIPTLKKGRDNNLFNNLDSKASNNTDKSSDKQPVHTVKLFVEFSF